MSSAATKLEDPPLRILQIYVNPRRIGGSERSLSVSVSMLRARGHRSYLLCADTSGAGVLPAVDEIIERPDIFIHEPLPPWKASRLRSELLAIVEEISPDVVHVRGGLRPAQLEAVARRWPTVANTHVPLCPNGMRFRFKDAAACERRVGLACVTSGFASHGCGHLATGAPVSVLAFARSFRTTKHMLRALGRCHCVVASSNWQASRLATDGVPPDRIVVINPPIESLLRAEAIGPPVVAVAGRVLPIKGIDDLIRASSVISVPHLVWIIGEGPDRARLERLAMELGIRERVVFHGGVDPQNADELLSQAAVITAPSRVPETFHQVGAQAAAAGIPVVGYEVGGMDEWAELYTHVTLVSAGDWRALASAIERSFVLKSSDNGDAHPGRFSPAWHVEQLLATYKRAKYAAEYPE